MKDLNNKIEKIITEEHESTIKDYIKRFSEYRNLKPEHDFKYIVEFMRELITEGDTEESYSIMTGSDEYDFDLYDRMQRIMDFIEDETTSDLINFIELSQEGEVYKISQDDYFENEYLTEDLYYIFDLDKNLYKEKIFYYCDSHQGTLYLNNFYIDKLDLEYIKNDDDLHDFLYDYDIKQLWTNFLFYNYRDSFKIEMPSSDLKNIEQECLKSVKEELNKRLLNLNTNIQELEEEFLKLSISSPLCFNLIKDEQNKLKQEIKEIQEVLK